MIILKILSRKIVWNTSYRMMDKGCCAVVLAQHLGQNSRFAQKPPRGWLRPAQNTWFWARNIFRRRRKKLLRAFFVRRRQSLGIFFVIRRRRKTFLSTFFSIRRRRMKIFRPILLFAVVDRNKLAPFAIRRRLLLFFRHFLLFAVTQNKIKGAFPYSP